MAFKTIFSSEWLAKLISTTEVQAVTKTKNQTKILASTVTGSTPVGQVGHSATGGVSPGRSWLSFDFVFQAEATSLPATVTCNPSGSLFGNGTRQQTFVTLEELPNHVVTTDWT